MQRTMLKSKIHRATVTDCRPALRRLDHRSIPSCSRPPTSSSTSRSHVVDVDNGARFETYTIAGERGSGEMKVNGAAARLVHHGDTIIVISYAPYDEAELEHYEPRVVHVEARQPHHRPSTARWRPSSAEGANRAERGAPPCPPHPSRPRRARRPPPSACRSSLPELAEKKRLGEPIVMVTAYDYPSAQVAEAAGVDMVLVGDSGAMTVLGYPSTVPVSVDEMLMLAAAARRGLRTPLLVGDLPVRLLRGLRRAGGRDRAALRQGGGAATRSSSRAAASMASARGRIVQRRHPGDGPRRPDAADGDRARRLPRAGPHRPSARSTSRATRSRSRRRAASRSSSRRSRRRSRTTLMERMEIPVIGIGAGAATDGQVLVFHDLLGIREGVGARFVKRYADIQDGDGRRRARLRGATCARTASRRRSTPTRSIPRSSRASARCSRRRRHAGELAGSPARLV